MKETDKSAKKASKDFLPKLKNTYKKTFTRKNKFLLGIILSVLIASFLMLIYVFTWQYSGLDKAITYMQEHSEITSFSLVVVFLLLILLISIIGNSTVSIGIGFALITVIMFINQEKMNSRNTPFLPEDLMMSSEAGALSSMVNIWAILGIIALVVFFIGGSIYIDRILKKKFDYKFPKKYKHILRIALLFSSFTALAYHTDFIRNKVEGNYVKVEFLNTEINSYNQEENYRINGFIIGTICNIQPKKMVQPEGYSKEKIDEITKKYAQIAEKENKNKKSLSDEKVNIVYTMSESFIDPKLAKDIYDYGENDPIPYTRSIVKENTSGWTATSEYGGGTANVEFEAITGMSNNFLSVIPYSNFVSHIPNFPSTVGFMNQNNMKTSALHPFGKTMYKRDIVYANFGFSNFKGVDDFKFTDKIDNSQYISDESAYNQVLYELENEKSSSFIHLVTMQNHMPYDKDVYNENDKFKISGHEDDRTDADKIETYLTGINKSDQALKKFIEKIDKLDEKTVLVFWGDHWPGIYGKMFDKNNNDIHRTPLFIYSNFSTGEKNNLETMSLNYLTPTVLEEVDAKMSPFHYLLLDVKKSYPALTRDFKYNNSSKEDKQKLADYELIEYDILSGAKWSQENNFFK